MTYEEIVQRVKADMVKTDAGNVKEHVAVQINITGEGEGAFYIEVKDGRIDVQPFEYYDRDVLFIAPSDRVLEVTSGNNKLGDADYIEGNPAKVAAFDRIIFKRAKKTTPRKAAEKKAAPKAAEKKPTVKKAAPKAAEKKISK